MRSVRLLTLSIIFMLFHVNLVFAGEPQIWFTSVPPLGSFSSLRGRVAGVEPKDFRVTVYILVHGAWWGPKPYWDRPLTSISRTGRWRTDITTGGIDEVASFIVAYLVPSNYVPPSMAGGAMLPEDLDAHAVAKAEVPRVPTATNLSSPTLCAEQDNVEIPLMGKLRAFAIEATHPAYPVGTNSCAADFTNCSSPSGPMYPFSPAVVKLFDDGQSVVEAITEASWWRPQGMTVSIQRGGRAKNVHYLRISRKVADEFSWPQFLVLYADGNVRLIPHPPVGLNSVCFGSSVIVGPTTEADNRPLAEIRSVKYDPKAQTLKVRYVSGGSATLSIEEVSRTQSRVGVSINYPTSTLPFATFRSMFVGDGNADVDQVEWSDASGSSHDDPVLSFAGGSSARWIFHRNFLSQHNQSAPDLSLVARPQ